MDIKIFVSHRIDKKSKQIDNPLFCDVRCGAVFDKEESSLLGDNTGDNISSKRMSYCELTVQYWAWKNVKADYYGFCHYRRYISFAERQYPENVVGVIEYPMIDETAIQRFRLDENSMRKEIEKYDIITHHGIPVSQSGDFDSVFDYCEKNPQGYKTEDIDVLREVVKEKYPEDIADFDAFFAGDENRWYNCYIMKAELFDAYASWLFDILFEFERRIDIAEHTTEQYRVIGVMAERLWGVYLRKLNRERGNNCRIEEKQLVYFQSTEEAEPLPQPQKDAIPVAIRLDNDTASRTWVTVKSILQHTNKDIKYHIFLLHKQAKESLIDPFLQLGDLYQNITIDAINVSRFVDQYQRIIGDGIECASCIDFSVFDVFRTVNKMIVAAPGVVVQEDIGQAYNMKGQDSFAAAPLDYLLMADCYESKELQTAFADQLGKTAPWIYYNVDFCILNIEAIVQLYPASSFVKMLGKHDFGSPFRDALNAKLNGHFEQLDPEWGVQPDYDEYIHLHTRWFLPYCRNEEYLSKYESPKVITFTWYAAPWSNAQVDYASEYWHYLRGSIFYEKEIENFVVQKAMEVVSLSKLQATQSTSGARAFIDKVLPKGTRRREFVKWLFPKGSWQRNFCKKIYFFLWRPDSSK